MRNMYNIIQTIWNLKLTLKTSNCLKLCSKLFVWENLLCDSYEIVYIQFLWIIKPVLHYVYVYENVMRFVEIILHGNNWLERKLLKISRDIKGIFICFYFTTT